MSSSAKKLGILVGGGPALGINSVINAVTIEAINSGLDVVDGFQHLIDGRIDQIRPHSFTCRAAPSCVPHAPTLPKP
jgi:6-phosphofructokinase